MSGAEDDKAFWGCLALLFAFPAQLWSLWWAAWAVMEIAPFAAENVSAMVWLLFVLMVVIRTPSDRVDPWAAIIVKVVVDPAIAAFAVTMVLP